MKTRLKPGVPLVSSILLALLLTGCTLNEGDPQTTLCQKLTAYISNTDVQWGNARKTPQADKSMKVEVASSDNSLTGMCIYRSDADDAGKDYDVNILDGYQNIPTSMVINGNPVPTKQLYVAIQKVTGQSVKDTLKKL
jgi:hypothetical protein